MKTLIDKIRDNYVERTPHMRDIGLKVTGLDASKATMVMPANPQWLGDSVRGMLHPGPLTVLADSCCGLAVSAALVAPAPMATLDLRMDYLRRAGPELDVHCEARCFRMARNVAFVDADVWQDDRSEPIAIARGAFMLSTAPGKRPAVAGGIASPDPAASAKPTQPGELWQAPADSEPVFVGRSIPYADYLGIRVSQTATGPLFRLPYHEKLIGNPRLPALHGGVVAGFSETAALVHVIKTLRGTKFPKSIDFSIDYLRSGRPQDTYASCDVVRIGTRVALVQVRCWQSGPDYPITVSRVHLLLTDPDEE
jgi:uncharacterized protein (TIGR00369 family)